MLHEHEGKRRPSVAANADNTAGKTTRYTLLYGLPSSGTRPSRERTGIPGHSPGSRNKRKLDELVARRATKLDICKAKRDAEIPDHYCMCPKVRAKSARVSEMNGACIDVYG